MAAKTVRIPQKIIQHYIDLLQNRISVDGVLLFGSFAYGRPNRHSDVDLAIISSDFNRKTLNNRLQWLSRMRDDLTCQIAMDIIGYTPEEFAEIEKHSAIMAKAKKDGKWLYKRRGSGL